jgi:ATP-dependent RNA helicase DHR2
LLTLKARHIDDIFSFPFLDRPDRRSLERGLLHLYNLNALDDEGNITDMGQKMANFPLTPAQSRILIAAADAESDVLLEVIDVLACISTENIFLNPERAPIDPSRKHKKNNKHQSDASHSDSDDLTAEDRVLQARKSITHPTGDHLTLLTLLRRYLGTPPLDQKSFCAVQHVSHSALQKTLEIRRQLRSYARSAGLPLPPDHQLTHESDTTLASYPVVTNEVAERLLRCFVKAMWMNTARKEADGKFRTIVSAGIGGEVEVGIHPSSCLKGESVMRGDGEGREAVMYQEVVYTTRTYARCVSRVRVEWIAEAGLGEGFGRS